MTTETPTARWTVHVNGEEIGSRHQLADAMAELVGDALTENGWCASEVDYHPGLDNSLAVWASKAPHVHGRARDWEFTGVVIYDNRPTP